MVFIFCKAFMKINFENSSEAPVHGTSNMGTVVMQFERILGSVQTFSFPKLL